MGEKRRVGTGGGNKRRRKNAREREKVVSCLGGREGGRKVEEE